MNIHYVKYNQSEGLSVERSQGNLRPGKVFSWWPFYSTDCKRKRIIRLLIQVNHLEPKGVVVQELKFSSLPMTFLWPFPRSCLNLQWTNWRSNTKRKLITVNKPTVCSLKHLPKPDLLQGRRMPRAGSASVSVQGWGRRTPGQTKNGLNCGGTKTQVRWNKSRQCVSSRDSLNITLTLQSKLKVLQIHMCM